MALVPLTLFNLDGSMTKNKKSELMPRLEKDSALLQLFPSNEPTLAVVDLMMLLRMVCTETSACETFGELSDLLLQVILGLRCKDTAVVGDSYKNLDSIKSGERARSDQKIHMQEI